MTEKLISIEKIDLSEKDKETVTRELDHIQTILIDIVEEDENVAYADTDDAMGMLDSILGGDPAYDARLSARVEASKKCMQGSDEEKKKGLKEAVMWVQQIRGLI